MARFELATSSLPRRHTAGLCHIGTYNNQGTGPVTECRYQGRALPANHWSGLPTYVGIHPYKTLWKMNKIRGLNRVY
jgi:hypothetical protein